MNKSTPATEHQIKEELQYNPTLKQGDKFTISGFMRGEKGNLVVDGMDVKTKRKCKVVGQAVYIVTGVITGKVTPPTIAPKIIGRPPLPPTLKTKPYTVWLTDAERSKVKQQERGWLRNLIRKAKP